MPRGRSQGTNENFPKITNSIGSSVRRSFRPTSQTSTSTRLLKSTFEKYSLALQVVFLTGIGYVGRNAPQVKACQADQINDHVPCQQPLEIEKNFDTIDEAILYIADAYRKNDILDQVNGDSTSFNHTEVKRKGSLIRLGVKELEVFAYRSKQHVMLVSPSL